MPVLIDGNNVMHRLPAGERTREGLRRRVLGLAHRQRIRLEVIFDGPPPDGTPPVEPLGAVTIRYSGTRTADDLIVARIPRGASARDWTVVTDDRELVRRVTAAGARTLRALEWLRRTAPPPGEHEAKPDTPSPGEIQEWLDIFSNR